MALTFISLENLYKTKKNVFQHWDKDLALMAEYWLHQCHIGMDSCDFICKYLLKNYFKFC